MVTSVAELRPEHWRILQTLHRGEYFSDLRLQDYMLSNGWAKDTLEGTSLLADLLDLKLIYGEYGEHSKSIVTVGLVPPIFWRLSFEGWVLMESRKHESGRERTGDDAGEGSQREAGKAAGN